MINLFGLLGDFLIFFLGIWKAKPSSRDMDLVCVFFFFFGGGRVVEVCGGQFLFLFFFLFSEVCLLRMEVFRFALEVLSAF